MLFRVKTQRWVTEYGAVFERFHWLKVGRVLHTSKIRPHSPNKVFVAGQVVPKACLERIPNTKANLRKFAKGLL